MDRDKLRAVIEEAAVDSGGRKELACAKAFMLASEHGVAIGEIGRVCNEEDIRISNCQLGCFK